MLAVAPPSALSQPVPPASAPCADLDVIFARGSGGKLNSVESLRLQAQVAAGAKAAGITTNFYELGSRPDQQYAYPAVSVNDEKGALTALGAKVSGGQAFEYGRSVHIGVADAVHYIAQRVEKCKDARFFISGVSQGAQVIGEAYRELPVNLRERVIFNALFGDPKLYLPEGQPELTPAGITYPRYERGERSEWRRGVPDPSTFVGSLGARIPYLPEGWTHTTGLWCNDNDFVCGSDLNPLVDSGHHQYDVENGPIDQAVREALDRFVHRLAVTPLVDARTTGREPTAVTQSPALSVSVNPTLGGTLLSWDAATNPPADGLCRLTAFISAKPSPGPGRSPSPILRLPAVPNLVWPPSAPIIS
jgi:cutinase